MVATTTKKAAREALDITQGEFNNFVTETENPIEMAAAMSSPGTAFIQPLVFNRLKDDHYKWWVKDGLRPWDHRDPDLILEKEEE